MMYRPMTNVNSKAVVECRRSTLSYQECSLETLVLVSRRLEDMKNGLGLRLEEKVRLDALQTLSVGRGNFESKMARTVVKHGDTLWSCVQ